MLIRLHFLAVAIAASFPVFAAEADEAPVLAPSSAWNVDYADKECRLLRTFGDGSSRSLFSLTQSDPGGAIRLVLATPALDGKRGEGLSIGLGPAQPALEMYKPLTGAFENFGTGIATSLDRDPVSKRAAWHADWEAVHWIDAKSDGKTVVRFGLGSMRQPLIALRKCVDDLSADWEIDQEAHWNSTRAASPIDLFDVLRAMDFSQESYRRSEDLVSQYRLLIDESGKPTKCVSQPSKNPAGFDDRVCKILLKEARFKPALAQDGSPMKSYFNSSFRYQVPR